MSLDEKDIRIDLYRAGQCTVRVTHLPSGKTATSDPQDSPLAAKQQAIERLQRSWVGRLIDARLSAEETTLFENMVALGEDHDTAISLVLMRREGLADDNPAVTSFGRTLKR